ncbi:MAG: hypothetical protein COB37_04550 [Kordiimonadales bacterium]|nr:MAG: hypothetical protein COB37_04550 [Kordiimonadales bacterium]
MQFMPEVAKEMMNLCERKELEDFLMKSKIQSTADAIFGALKRRYRCHWHSEKWEISPMFRG